MCLFEKFRKRFSGKNLKTLMWRVINNTYPQAWERKIRTIKKVNDEAFRHLLALPPRQVFISPHTPFVFIPSI